MSDSRNIAPSGWHVPTDADWAVLTSYLGGDSIAGRRMRSRFGWVDECLYCTNSSGFSVLFGGARGPDGNFGNSLTWEARFWSASQSDSVSAWARSLDYTNESAFRSPQTKKCGFSVRCIKD